MGTGPQLVTGICVLLLKFVCTKAGPPNNNGNSDEKIFAIAVEPAAVAACSVATQLSDNTRRLWGGIVSCLSDNNDATTPADRLKIVCD